MSICIKDDDDCGRNIVVRRVDLGDRTKRPSTHLLVKKIKQYRDLRFVPHPKLAIQSVQPLVKYKDQSDNTDNDPSTESSGGAGGDLASIRQCESGGNYSTNTGNGFTGAYQFDDSTWKAAGGSTSSAYQASSTEQDQVARNWIAQGNRSAWPNC